MSATPTTRAPGNLGEVVRLATPLIISLGSATVMHFCDRIFLAHYSGDAIQAALPAGILVFALICGFVELANYSNTFVSQYWGAGRPEGCSRATAQGVLLAVFSWPLMLGLIPVGRWLIHLSGHPAEVQELERTYFTILMYGSIGPPLGTAAAGFFSGRGDTRTTMVAHLIGSGLNIVLDYVLIFGKFGFPELGMAGAAIATVIAGLVPPAILLALFFSRRVDARFGSRRAFRLDGRLMLRMLRFGAPAAIHITLDISSFSLFVWLIGRLGEAALAASNIALSINHLAFMPLLALHIATVIVVGKYQGAGDSDAAVRGARNAYLLGAGYMVVTGLSFLLFPAFYFGLFTSDAANAIALDTVLPLGRWLLLLMALWGFWDAGNLIFAGALKGAGDTRFVMCWSVGIAWGVWVPGLFLLLKVFHAGALGLWIWATTYICVLCVGFYLRWRSGRWRSIRVIEPHIPLEPHVSDPIGLLPGE